MGERSCQIGVSHRWMNQRGEAKPRRRSVPDVKLLNRLSTNQRSRGKKEGLDCNYVCMYAELHTQLHSAHSECCLCHRWGGGEGDMERMQLNATKHHHRSM